MARIRPAAPRWAALLAAAAILLGTACPRAVAAGVFAGSVVARAEGRAPVQGGRFDTAFEQALEEAFRRGVLDALRTIAPERQSPRDLEFWQETVLSRAADFVGSWKILDQEESGGFVRLQTELEIWREKLAHVARATTSASPAPAVRIIVLADPLPAVDSASDEEVDASRYAVALLEAEFARRGAVILSTSNRAPWLQAEGPASEENRVALAAAEGKRLEADAVLIAELTRRGAEGFTLSVQLIAASSEATLGSSRTDVAPPREVPLAEAFGPAARQSAAALVPRLPAARSARARPSLP